MNNNSEYCVFCSTRLDKSNKTRDHIPAKSFFPRPRPDDLITVPCCHKCNNSRSSDDFYTSFLLLIHEETERTDIVKQLTENAKRRLNQPENRSVRDAILKSITVEQAIHSICPHNSARYKAAYDIDVITSTISSYTRGLFYHEYGYCYPYDFEVHTRWWPTLDNNQLEVIHSTFVQLINQAWRRNWPDIFAYKYVKTLDDPDVTVWMLQFFGHQEFISMTLLM